MSAKAASFKIVLALAILLAAGAGGGWYWKHRQDDGVAYQTQAVTRGDITQTVTATGTLNPVLNVQVGSQISGIIAKLFADYNAVVKEGQIVAQIDPATYQATVAQAEGELASAKADLELAKINLKRDQELRARNAVPQATLDQTEATLHKAEASVKVKEGALAKARVDLDRCKIYSPIDGIVISRSVDVGQTVAASLSAPVLFTIANDLAKMQIDANVAEADVGHVEQDQNVDFTVDAFPNRTFHGKIVQVRNAPLTVQNVVSYDTVIGVNNEDLKLKPGMTANASIVVAHRESVIKVSGAAFRFRPADATTPASGEPKASFTGKRTGGAKKAERRSERTVYVLKDGKPAPVQIKTGITDGIFTEVTEGLNEGDPVIIGSTGGQPASQPIAAPGGPFGGPGGMRMR